MWYLDVVVNRLRCTDCLNPWVIKLIVPLSEVKSFFAVLSFCIKIMQRRTLQGCSLEHSVKKACFSVSGKIEIILVGQGGLGGVLPHSPLGHAPENSKERNGLSQQREFTPGPKEWYINRKDRWR